MVFQIDERDKEIAEKSREAIQFAMQCRWPEAALVNEQLLELAPQDVEASNRLGRAYLEMGEHEQARKAFERTLSIAPDNAIARKNLDRLAHAESAGGAAQAAAAPLLSPAHFICDGGTTARMVLREAGKVHPASCAVGTAVQLHPSGGVLTVEDRSGAYLGVIPPHVGSRLNRLIAGGNRYEAAIVAASNEGVTILVRETYRHPSQRNVISFPESAVLQPPLGVSVQREPEPDEEHETVVEDHPPVTVPLEEHDDLDGVASEPPDDEGIFLSEGDEGSEPDQDDGDESPAASSEPDVDDGDDDPVIDDGDDDEE